MAPTSSPPRRIGHIPNLSKIPQAVPEITRQEIFRDAPIPDTDIGISHFWWYRL